VSWSLVLVTAAPTAVVLVALAVLRRACRDEFAEASRLAAARAVTTRTADVSQPSDRSR
jgi:hypothetical protein